MAVAAVSYTHLDVYKRQQLELSAAAGDAPEKVAKTLVETARVRAQKTGRPDDITAAVLRLEKCV